MLLFLTLFFSFYFVRIHAPEPYSKVDTVHASCTCIIVVMYFVLDINYNTYITINNFIAKYLIYYVTFPKWHTIPPMYIMYPHDYCIFYCVFMFILNIICCTPYLLYTLHSPPPCHMCFFLCPPLVAYHSNLLSLSEMRLFICRAVIQCILVFNILFYPNG